MPAEGSRGSSRADGHGRSSATGRPRSRAAEARYDHSGCRACARSGRQQGRMSRVLLDEREDAIPGVLRRLCELLLLAIEEAVRSTLVRDELVLDARLRQGPIERCIVFGADVLVVA